MPQPSDVVLIPFPFTDLTSSKKRPVLVVSPANDQGDFIGLQITSKSGYSPVIEISGKDFTQGVLPKISYIRVNKIFTLNESTITGRVGRLADETVQRVEARLCRLWDC